MTSSTQKTYFTFSDNTLRYDCRTCGSECCKGKGIGLDFEDEYSSLIAKTPELAYFMSFRGELPHSINLRSGCWFLDSEGLCQIHSKADVAHKPAACRLFPFNRIFYFRGIRIVDFNSVICPLIPSETQPEIRHTQINEEISRIKQKELISSPVDINGDTGPKEVIALEQAIQDAAISASDSYLTYSALQLRLTREQLGVGQKPAVIKKELELWKRAILAIPGTSFKDKLSKDILKIAVLLTPSIRFNELFRQDDLPYLDAISLLPKMLYVWTLFLEQAKNLSEKNLSLQDGTELWNHLRVIFYPLARLNDRPKKTPGKIELNGPDSLQKVGIVFARSCANNSKKKKTLRALLVPHLNKSLVRTISLMHILEPLWKKMSFF